MTCWRLEKVSDWADELPDPEDGCLFEVEVPLDELELPFEEFPDPPVVDPVEVPEVLEEEVPGVVAPVDPDNPDPDPDPDPDPAPDEVEPLLLEPSLDELPDLELLND